MRKPLTLGLLAVLAALSPAAWAGSVFVPLAANLSLAGDRYATKVWVSNTGAVGRRFNLTFIPAGTDGSAVTPSLSNLFVPAGGTVELTDVVPPGQTGLLEVSGAPQLVVHARLELSGPTGFVQVSTTVPIVTQATALAAGTVSELLGLERASGGVISNYALINLSLQAAQCTVAAFRADNSQIANTANLVLQPLSRRDFDDALSILGQSNISNVRFETSCDHQFFTYATVTQLGVPVAAFVTSSPALVADVVTGPVQPGGPPSSGSVTFTQPGVFLNATDANSEVDYDLPVPAGVPYKRTTIDFDMHIGSFPPGLFTGVMSFRRPNANRNDRVVYAAIQVVNQKHRTTLDLGVDNVLVKADTPWQEKSDYHLKLIYDIKDVPGTVTLIISQGSTVLATLTGPPQHYDMSANANPLRVNFGQTGIGDGAYFPPVTWIFSNLKVLLEP
ncbi:MAG TPA: hypothetical protein VHR45_06215 [Thermoanaerobaculia bacterium]|nr:hypothetical protein [Thermoanaerobaculia bacterium]